MQNFFPSLTSSSIGLIIVGTISVAVGFIFIVYDIYDFLKKPRIQEQERQIRWHRRPRMVLGIGLIVFIFPMVLDAIILSLTFHHYLAPSFETLSVFIGIVSILLWFAAVIYAAILQIQNRR